MGEDTCDVDTQMTSHVNRNVVTSAQFTREKLSRWVNHVAKLIASWNRVSNQKYFLCIY